MRVHPLQERATSCTLFLSFIGSVRDTNCVLFAEYYIEAYINSINANDTVKVPWNPWNVEVYEVSVETIVLRQRC